MAKREKVVTCETWVPLRKDGSVRLHSTYTSRRKPDIWDDDVDRFVWGKCTITYTEDVKPRRIVRPAKAKRKAGKSARAAKGGA